VDGLHVATPPVFFAINLHPIVHLSLSCKFHLGRYCDGGGFMIHLAECASSLQNLLWSAVLEEHPDVDHSHYGPLSPFRFFYVNTFKEVRKCGGEIIKVGLL